MQNVFSNYNKFQVLQNSDPMIDSLSKINEKKHAKSNTNYDDLIFYPKLPHDKLVDKLSSVTSFVFKADKKNLTFEYQLMDNSCYFSDKK